jgi:hypothetical protein
LKDFRGKEERGVLDDESTRRTDHENPNYVSWKCVLSQL